jgi:hypothetical protein
VQAKKSVLLHRFFSLHRFFGKNTNKPHPGKFMKPFDVFICHSSKDKEFILLNIIPAFKNYNIVHWIDCEQINFGDGIIRKIEHGLRNSRYLVPCLSKNLGTSNWISAEYSAILNAEFSGASDQRVVPLNLDDCGNEDIPPLLRDLRRASYNKLDEFNQFLEFLKPR